MELLTVGNLIIAIISLIQGITLYFFKEFKSRLERSEVKIIELDKSLAMNTLNDKSKNEFFEELKTAIKEMRIELHQLGLQIAELKPKK